MAALVEESGSSVGDGGVVGAEEAGLQVLANGVAFVVNGGEVQGGDRGECIKDGPWGGGQDVGLKLQ